MISAAFFELKASRLSASPTFFPRIWSATKRAFWAEIRAPDSLAATSIVPYPLTLGFLVRSVPTISAGTSELAEFVADHVFVHEDRDMLTTVMHSDGQTDHLRQNDGATRPGFNRLAIVLFHRHFDLLQEVKIDKRTFFQRTRHCRSRLITYGGERSCCRYACSHGSSHPWSGSPTAKPGDDHQRYDPHHHHAGGRPGSWQHHERSGERRANAWHQPYPGSAGCARSWKPRPGLHGTRREPCASRRSADAG